MSTASLQKRRLLPLVGGKMTVVIPGFVCCQVDIVVIYGLPLPSPQPPTLEIPPVDIPFIDKFLSFCGRHAK